jgi:hypothetical protein
MPRLGAIGGPAGRGKLSGRPTIGRWLSGAARLAAVHAYAPPGPGRNRTRDTGQNQLTQPDLKTRPNQLKKFVAMPWHTLSFKCVTRKSGPQAQACGAADSSRPWDPTKPIQVQLEVGGPPTSTNPARDCYWGLNVHFSNSKNSRVTDLEMHVWHFMIMKAWMVHGKLHASSADF